MSYDKETASGSFTLGEQAHIVGKEKGSPRSDSILSVEEREAYHNLILLCPTHHTLIDNNPEDYPIEKLHMFKTQHEYWVENTLSETYDVKSVAADIIYAHLIDLAVEGCSLNTFEGWMSGILGPQHKLAIDTYNKLLHFTLEMHKAVWPGTLKELESTMKYFSTVLNIALGFYIKNAESKEDYYLADKFYKKQWHKEETYQRLLNEYNAWEEFLEKILNEIVKAANWFADNVRRDINPLFMATAGKFSFCVGPDDDLTFHTIILEYSVQEKSALIESYKDKCIEYGREAASIKI